MATFNVPTIGTEIKPVPQSSLADMLGIARGAQAYQQAQQVNPLLLQQQQQTTRTGEIALTVEEQKDKERRNMQTFFADPNNFQTNGRIDIDKINVQVPKIAPLTGADYITKYSTLGSAQTDAIKAKQGLTQDQRSMVAQRFSILGRLGVKDKNAYIAEMDLLKKENPDNPDLSRLIDSYKTIWENTMQSGDDLPGKAIAGAQTLLTPTQQQSQLAPSVQVTPVGQTVTVQPSVGAQPPTATIAIAGGMQGGAPVVGGATPVGAGTEIAPNMRVPYPVRRADQPYMKEPTEEKDQAAGAEYRNNLVNGQMGLSQGRRNVEEVIQQANKIGESLVLPNFLAQFGFEKGGAPEKMERAVRQFFGSEQYDMLAKDLANMAITNSKAMGSVGGTVAGLDMASVANGTTKVTPDVLVKIARRVQADQTNLDMQANGAQKFALQFGDNNMKAYQQAWNANADSKIFEAINITRDITDPVKQKAELNRLFPNPAQFNDFLKKYKNIKSLSETGVSK
jgi:hypothetical protein